MKYLKINKRILIPLHADYTQAYKKGFRNFLKPFKINGRDDTI